MNKYWRVFVVVLSFASTLSADNPQNGSNQVMQTPMDCSNMSADMQLFAGKLNANNKQVFCGKMTDGQRAMSMQMAGQLDPNGKPVMTPDQAVDKVGQGINSSTPRGPSGCPVK